MTVFKTKIFSNQNRGASITEVLLAMAIIAIATPFVYNQIANTNHTIHDIAVARRVMSTRENALNFVLVHTDKV